MCIRDSYLARGLQIVSAVVDPEVYVLGGGASASADVYLDQLREKFAAGALSVSAKPPSRLPSWVTTPASSAPLTWRFAPPPARCRRISRACRMSVRRSCRRRMQIAVDEEAGSE